MSTIQKNLFSSRLCDDGRKSISIKLGIEPYNANELYCSLTDSGFKVHYSARDVMRSENFQISSTIKKIDTVAVTTKELGFDSHGGPLLEVYRRAMENGFSLCPAEVGPRLRKFSSDPLVKGKYFIGMSPITVRNKLHIFKLWNAGIEPWLETEEILISVYIAGTFIFLKN